jgi:hypothetical protein
MTEAETRLLGEAIRAGIERHRWHQPNLYRGADNIWRCPECEPPTLRERLSSVLATATAHVKRRR